MSIVKNPIRPGDGDPRHGTTNGYINHGCRCAECRGAWADYCYRRQAERAASNIPFIHGTVNGYTNYGCRCRPCTVAWSAANAERKRRARSKAGAR